jgi:hypothetical protein
VKIAQGRIQLLEAQKTTAEKINDDLNAKLQEAKERYGACQARLPDTALYKARKDWINGDHEKANDTVKGWIDREGDTISQLFLYRTKWAHEHAAKNLRSMGLLAAETYATAAVALWPQNQEAVDLREDILDYRDAAGPCSLPLNTALTEFDEKADKLFRADDVETANEAEEEGWNRYFHGHYHLALPVAELAIRLSMETVGETAIETLRAKHLEVYILIGMGHPEKALQIAQSIVDVSITHQALGPTHANTLSSRYLVAAIRNLLGYHEEALENARTVEADQAIQPGTSDREILRSRELIAEILHSLGRDEEALENARTVETDQAAKLGTFDRETLASGSLIAQILHSLGRNKEALEKLQTVEADRADQLGTSHPDTLRSGVHIAEILHSLGRSKEALEKAQTVEALQAAQLGHLIPILSAAGGSLPRLSTRLADTAILYFEQTINEITSPRHTSGRLSVFNTCCSGSLCCSTG